MEFENRPIRMAIVGCGAIAQAHARAISAIRDAECAALFDVDPARAESLRGTHFPGARLAGSSQEVAKFADAAIVAVPNVYHASVTKSLLNEGMHVLCEKPLAISSSDAREMISVAEEAGRVIACGLVRRFFGSTALVTKALRLGILGGPLRFEAHESVWNWPMSRAAFDRRGPRGGGRVCFGAPIFHLLPGLVGAFGVFQYFVHNRGGGGASSLV